MAPVVAPLAGVDVALGVAVHTAAVHLAVHPVALVLVAVRVRQLPVAFFSRDAAKSCLELGRHGMAGGEVRRAC